MEFFEGLFTLHSLFTLVMLVLLQAVLGLDNLLYISIESQTVAEKDRSMVRQWGIGLAIVLRLVLLIVLMFAIEKLQKPFFSVHLPSVIEVDVNIHAFIVIGGGAFIIYTAVKEIFHMLSLHDLSKHGKKKSQRSVGAAIVWIVIMNLVFSFDSILSAIALTKNFIVMGCAIVISGVMMIWLSDHVSRFLQKNRMYEVLGLFILFIVGIMLLGEGGHLAHLRFFGQGEVEPMAKSTFYFVLGVLVIVDIVQSRYQKKLLAQAAAEVTDSH